MTMPNFLLLGTQKGGTTSLALHLAKHPQIFMSSVKEPGFFDFEGQQPNFCGPGDRELYRFITTEIEAYRQLFEGVSDEIAIGEATTWYLYSPKAPERIHQYIPDVKLIAILRNPVDRAYSAFMHAIRDDRETLTDFAQALEEEETRINQNWEYLWHYKQMGFYYVQLKRYFDLFDRSQIRIYLYEDLNSNPTKLLQDICQFLNVDEVHMPKMSQRINKSGIPKNRLLHQLLKKPNPIKTTLRFLVPSQKIRWQISMSLRNQNVVKPGMPSAVRNKLCQVYHEDILKLQDLIEYDLSSWLE